MRYFDDITQRWVLQTINAGGFVLTRGTYEILVALSPNVSGEQVGPRRVAGHQAEIFRVADGHPVTGMAALDGVPAGRCRCRGRLEAGRGEDLYESAASWRRSCFKHDLAYESRLG